MAGEGLPARFSLLSQFWFHWIRKCLETATSHMQTVSQNLKPIDMNKIILTSISIIFAFNSIFAQTKEEKYANDVKSIDAIINAYYDVVSGSSSEPWEFERDKYIHSENAVITRLDENGKAESHTLEAEYIPIGLSPKEDFYEKELKRKVSKYGNIAQVWSAFEIRTDPKKESNIRGLNSVQLHYENGRWFIDSWTCEMESEKSSVVTEFMANE